MHSEYLEKSKERMPCIPMLINLVSRRVRQLNAGHRPLVKPDTMNMQAMDIALKEIAEGKLTAEIALTPTEETIPASNEKVISL